MAVILTAHRRQSTGVNNQINDGQVPFSFLSPTVTLSWQGGTEHGCAYYEH